MVIKYLKQTITGRSSPKNKRLIILSSPDDDVKSVVVSQSTEQFWSFTVKQSSAEPLKQLQTWFKTGTTSDVSSADAPRYKTGLKKGSTPSRCSWTCANTQWRAQLKTNDLDQAASTRFMILYILNQVSSSFSCSGECCISHFWVELFLYRSIKHVVSTLQLDGAAVSLF